jgi:hypothetical protein
MPKLEQVVRPFQAGDVFTAKSLPAVQPVTTIKPDIVVIWGKPINLQMKAIGITNLFGGQRLSEVSRTTRTRRVTNPQDETQFVDVEEITTLRMQDSKQQFHDFEFTPQGS